jgi:hypothetical protein
LLRPDAIHLDYLQVFEKTLVLKYLKENPSLFVTQVNQSNRAIIQKKEFHNVKHDNSFNTIDCHTVEFRLNNIIKYGSIFNFISIKTDNFCIVNIYKQKPINWNHSKKLCPILINRFFVEVEATTDYLLLSFSFITRRCILSTYSGSVLKEKKLCFKSLYGPKRA